MGPKARSRWMVLLGGILAGCGGARPSSPAPVVSTPKAEQASESNILRGDYVGSSACAACHAKETGAWAKSPMHRMTRNPDSGDVRTLFDGRAMHFKGASVTLSMTDGKRLVRIENPGAPPELYRVTRVIGGRTREDFAGVRIESASDLRSRGAEMVLPVSQLFFSTHANEDESGSPNTPFPLRYKGYSVLVPERPVLRAGPVWSETCIFCHNTVPFFSTLFGALRGDARPGYQGEDVDPLLPEERRWSFGIRDERKLAEAAADEIAHLGGTAAAGGDMRAVLSRAIATTRDRFRAESLIEIGIGCEACHGGARAHAADPSKAPLLAPNAPFLTVKQALHDLTRKADPKAQAINRVCARCHQVLFSRYPWTWEGGRRNSSDRGGSPISSGEARDFLLGGCSSALSCTACHDPHDAGDRAVRDRTAATTSGNALCTRCHGAYGSVDAVRAHSHHDPAGAGGACIACHMPKKNLGLDLHLSRYHRIGSPTDRERVEGDRPLECALCHAEKSVRSLVTTMETWWGKRYSRRLLTALYGDMDARPLVATLARGKAHERAVAGAALGELLPAGDRTAAPLLAAELTGEYPLLRGFAARALSRSLGKDCGIDVWGAGVGEIRAEARRCFESVGLRAPAFPEEKAVETTHETEPTHEPD